MDPGELIGYVGGALITTAFIPQVVQLFRLKSAYEISLPFAIMSVLGIFGWLAYGIYNQLVPVIFWNAISAVLLLLLLYAKLKYGSSKKWP